MYIRMVLVVFQQSQFIVNLSAGSIKTFTHTHACMHARTKTHTHTNTHTHIKLAGICQALEEIYRQWVSWEGKVPRRVEEQELPAEALHDEGSSPRQNDLCCHVSCYVYGSLKERQHLLLTKDHMLNTEYI